jgi:hypothetical protein
VKNWNKTKRLVRQRKVIYGKEEDDILGKEKLILLEKLYMGQESLTRWDRRR